MGKDNDFKLNRSCKSTFVKDWKGMWPVDTGNNVSAIIG